MRGHCFGFNLFAEIEIIALKLVSVKSISRFMLGLL
jgi:hypothetical protein